METGEKEKKTVTPTVERYYNWKELD